MKRTKTVRLTSVRDAEKVFDAFSSGKIVHADETVMKVALTAAANAKAAIASGTVKPPNTPYTLAHKAGKRPLYDTGKYHDSLTAIKQRDGWYRVGPLSPNEKHDDEHTYGQISLMHELGTDDLPARPHLRPAILKALSKMPKRF